MSNIKSNKSSAPVIDAPVEAQDAPVQDGAATAPEAQQAHGVEALALAVGATSKDVRRWLRAQTREALGRAGAQDVLPGKGGRYAFTPADVEALARAYGASKAQRGTRAPAAAIMAALAPVE